MCGPNYRSSLQSPKMWPTANAVLVTAGQGQNCFNSIYIFKLLQTQSNLIYFCLSQKPHRAMIFVSEYEKSKIKCDH